MKHIYRKYAFAQHENLSGMGDKEGRTETPEILIFLTWFMLVPFIKTENATVERDSQQQQKNSAWIGKIESPLKYPNAVAILKEGGESL